MILLTALNTIKLEKEQICVLVDLLQSRVLRLESVHAVILGTFSPNIQIPDLGSQ